MVISTTHPLYDWQRLGGSYFTVEALRSLLNPDQDWPVRAWRRPLTQVCREFRDAGFVIDELIEPRPVPEMAASDPETYANLEHAPAFIAFRLRPFP